MIRAAVVLGLTLPLMACALVFDEGPPPLPDGVSPDLQFSFEGSGDAALRSTGTMDLTLRLVGDARIVDGALDLTAAETTVPTLALSNATASAFVEACQLSREFSLSVWFSPGSVLPLERTPARIVTLEEPGLGATDFMIGQGSNNGFGETPEEFDSVTVRAGASRSGDVGEAVGLGLELGQPHWVGYSMDASGTFALYGDGESLAEPIKLAGTMENALDQWLPEINLAIGATSTGNRQWRGLVHHVDLFCQTLSEDELATLARASDPSR